MKLTSGEHFSYELSKNPIFDEWHSAEVHEIQFCSYEENTKDCRWGKEYEVRVIPFHLLGSKHTEIDPTASVFDKPFPAVWGHTQTTKHEPLVGGAQDNKKTYVTLRYTKASTPWAQALIRFNKLFSDGLEQVCKTVFLKKGVEFPSEGCCHHFVNYLVFGMKEQAYLDSDFKDWYDQLPFVEILSFSELTLRWGDIVQHTNMGKLIHSMVYVGNSRYISRHGNTYIYFQSLEATKLSYPSDNSRIVRLLPQYYSTELPFKVSYSDI